MKTQEQKGINWPMLTFPPINLWNVWPSPQMIKVMEEYKRKQNDKVSSTRV